MRRGAAAALPYRGVLGFELAQAALNLCGGGAEAVGDVGDGQWFGGGGEDAAGALPHRVAEFHAGNHAAVWGYAVWSGWQSRSSWPPVPGLARVGRTLPDQRRYDCSSSGGWPT